MDPGYAIRTARRRAGLSQRELAERAGTSQATVSAYERGRKEPSFGTLVRLIEASGSRLLLDPGEAEPRRPLRTPRELGHELLDVLSLVDAMPSKRDGPLKYPRLPVPR